MHTDTLTFAGLRRHISSHWRCINSAPAALLITFVVIVAYQLIYHSTPVKIVSSHLFLFLPLPCVSVVCSGWTTWSSRTLSLLCGLLESSVFKEVTLRSASADRFHPWLHWSAAPLSCRCGAAISPNAQAVCTLCASSDFVHMKNWWGLFPCLRSIDVSLRFLYVRLLWLGHLLHVHSRVFREKPNVSDAA